MFDQGKYTLKASFKTVLTDFCPKYFDILDQYIPEIDEIRIEGHTSPEWNEGDSLEYAFFQNMRLSQTRTRAVMEYCFTLEDAYQYTWLPVYIRAVGMSSAKLALDENGNEDYDASRRVEFRIKTKAEERIASIMDGWQ